MSRGNHFSEQANHPVSKHQFVFRIKNIKKPSRDKHDSFNNISATEEICYSGCLKSSPISQFKETVGVSSVMMIPMANTLKDH